jgi:hypothetical protein
VASILVGTLKQLKAALSAAKGCIVCSCGKLAGHGGEAPGFDSAPVWAAVGWCSAGELGRALQAAVPTQLLVEGFRVLATCGSWDQ